MSDFTYNDTQAVADGTLTAIDDFDLSVGGVPVDRMTDTVAVWIGQHPEIDIPKLLGDYRDLAEADEPLGQMLAIGEGPVLWLTLNERGHYTLMFPSDY